ncbi:MAG: hypothetical protein AAF599_11015 [Bacteroidota bacterium]
MNIWQKLSTALGHNTETKQATPNTNISSLYLHLVQNGFFDDKQAVQQPQNREITWRDERGVLHGLFLVGDDQDGELYYNLNGNIICTLRMYLDRATIIALLNKVYTQRDGLIVKLYSNK